MIPVAIACGVLLLVLEGHALRAPSSSWGLRCGETLFETGLIGAIGRLAYRARRLWRLGREA